MDKLLLSITIQSIVIIVLIGISLYVVSHIKKRNIKKYTILKETKETIENPLQLNQELRDLRIQNEYNHLFAQIKSNLSIGNNVFVISYKDHSVKNEAIEILKQRVKDDNDIIKVNDDYLSSYVSIEWIG